MSEYYIGVKDGPFRRHRRILMLVFIAVIVVIIIVIVQSNRESTEQQNEHDSLLARCETMSLNELCAKHDAAERAWQGWIDKMGSKKEFDNAYRKMKDEEWKMKQIRNAINRRFPEVITDADKLKEKAYSVATSAERKELRLMESKLQASQSALKDSGLRGGQLLDMTHSSTLRGVAASSIAGPIAGAAVYSATEAQNKAIRENNLIKKAENAAYDRSVSSIIGMHNQTIAMYTDILSKHGITTKVYIFSPKYI